MRARAILCATLLAFASTAHALSALEFMKMDFSRQYDVAQPMLVTFLSAGYKKIPDNPASLVSRMKKIILDKGYQYQNVEDVGKEAAISLGMERSF
jgi:hypothetical protein